MDLILFTNPEQGSPCSSILHRRSYGGSTRLRAQALNNTSRGGAREVPPSPEKAGGEQGRGQSSWEALETYQGRRSEATWGLMVHFHQLGALLLHHSGIQ